MELTKHAHACVTFTDDGRTLLVDPGTFTPNAAELIAAADAVLITHEHFDHLDEAALAAELEKRPDLPVFGPAAIASKLGGRAVVVTAGDRITPAGFTASVHGGRHAVIHADIPVIDNVGYLVEGRVFHPGDSYEVPEVAVETLLLPTSGPWTKFGEAADFVRAVRPARVIQVHELMLSELGQNSARMLLGENGLTGLPLEIQPLGSSTAV
ncbi:L-ascorbate metabolism protein UlaG (beta-lactamase superfamily) [Actinoplanes lutulentus]|uniref:L-ascorbate metabolism protein UlaG (Beta-lactamase superfamily) n=1 Tax=Actinoplanes lutulentus TaxID=1287878 RepID=A0A327Z9K9_9ACTN|nr:MBL fold metallo-hydrolase [Actinoplanes lutulentus]MBB2948527.1 L-ascorbate metabolism protein UlaG (beta-lactamase superfamily) [Actinoplanes lutulentus]RAK34441.1 L-ascorbate metabolism protein UlaG (beta-lactamase superfamily) [Actinoplanes lutulentus]